MASLTSASAASGVEQLVAPANRCRHGFVAGFGLRGVSMGDAAAEFVGDLVDCSIRGLRCGDLDRKRQLVDELTDVSHDFGVLVGVDRTCRGAPIGA